MSLRASLALRLWWEKFLYPICAQDPVTLMYPRNKMQSCNPLYRRFCELVNACRLCLMHKMTQCLAPCRVQWVQKSSRPGNVPLGDYIFIFNHVYCPGEVHTIIYLHVKVLQRAFNKEFPISRSSKGAGEETWGLCLALLCSAQGGCSSCENFRAVFVQDSLAETETKLIKEKSQAVVCMELLLLILFGCGSACATWSW